MGRPRRLYHRLVVAAERARRRFDAESLERAGITAAQAAVLFALEASPGESQRRLAATLRIREPSAAQMLARLEEQGLVARRPAPDDGRARVVSLTPAGRRVLGRVRPALSRLNDWLTAGFTAEELEVVARFLDRLGEEGGGGGGS